MPVNEDGRPRVAAYCRVSTDKDDQLMSLKAQQEFFQEYAEKNRLNLVQLYTDEGISGTKLKKRKAFNRMMADAERGMFERVYVKDVSRLARNVVDFLQSIRRLKQLGIDCKFVTANMSSNDGELTLTILAAVAQEESANLSKRVKFGKRKNAEQGKVPNLVYGYDKQKGDYFHLSINDQEAATVKRIYSLYTDQGYGTGRIAQILNLEGIKTKRGCAWSQNAVRRILSNPLYTGRVVNGKELVEDFLTGRRVRTSPENQLTVMRDELRIIPEEQFGNAQRMMGKRASLFQAGDKRGQSNRYALSTLLRCEICGRSFRRIYKKRRDGSELRNWVCSTRNTRGKDACCNESVIEEDLLLQEICGYLEQRITAPQKVLEQTESELRRCYQPQEQAYDHAYWISHLEELQKAKRKLAQLFEADLITLDEARARTQGLNQQVERCRTAITHLEQQISDVDPLEQAVARYCRTLPDALSVLTHDNPSLKQVVERIDIAPGRKTKVYIAHIAGAQ